MTTRATGARIRRRGAEAGAPHSPAHTSHSVSGPRAQRPWQRSAYVAHAHVAEFDAPPVAEHAADVEVIPLQVERRVGFSGHGLPLEDEIEPGWEFD